MFVYILHSRALDSYYTGFCQDNLETRLLKHNTGFYDASYSKKTNDWTIVWTLKCSSNKQALAIEKHIKRMKSKVYIQNILKYNEISIKLLQKFQWAPDSSESFRNRGS